MKNSSSLKQNQSGLVSIIVTMILMIVLSLIVLGFAQVSRREQRQALDRQLSTEAYYASETGINDAHRAINDTNVLDPYSVNNPAAIPTGSGSNKNNCGQDTAALPNSPFVNNYGQVNGQLFQYTCLLINQTPQSLQTNVASTGPDVIMAINPSPSPLGSIVISWQQRNGGKTLPNSSPPNFPPPGLGWGDPTTTVGLLRIDLVDTSTLSRSALSKNDFVAFLYPTATGAGTTTYQQGAGSQSSTDSGQIVPAQCGGTMGPETCSVTISGLGGSSHYYLRMRSIYSDSFVNIGAPSTNTTNVFTGGQAVIDSTGKANDVLKRIQVRVGLTGSGSTNTTVPSTDMVPDYGLQSAASICKTMTVVPSGGLVNSSPNPATC